MKPRSIKIETLAFTGLAMAAFAANSILCRLALSHAAIDPATFTLVRLASGAAVLWLIVSLRRSPAPSGGSWAGALALFVYAAAFSFAYVCLPAGTGAFLLFGAVQMTMVGYGLLRGERLCALQWFGLTTAVAGLAALVDPGAFALSLTGACLMLTAGVAWGAYSLLGNGIADPLSATAGNFMRSLPFAILLFLSTLSFGTNVSCSGIACAILSGAVASGLGYGIWYAALPGLTSAQGASVQLSVPVMAALGADLLLGEAISLLMSVTSLAILGGIALVLDSRTQPLSRPGSHS
jgi:drug/metabolite transporter (DMT)-like permease